MQSVSGPTLSPYMLAPGAILAGKYRVEQVIGEGGMGVVIAATHVALDQKVALKILRVASADRPDAIERFLREARNAVRLRSQHVAKVLDVGTLDGGLPFIVLEYLEGADLDAVLRVEGPLVPQRAIALILQACEAVAEAHALGIVHRDIKPHNLFLTTGVGGGELVKVLDFGIAKSGGSFGGGVLTRSDSSVGSPLYMSPEQMRSPRDVDLRTDIWSLGVTLYELIAGKPPFDAESFPELVLKVQEGRLTPLSIARPEIPLLLSDAIGRCLKSDVTQRYASVAELATALEPFTWADARASAENVRRALGTSPSAPKPAAASHGTIDRADTSHSRGSTSEPKAWSESVGITSSSLDSRPTPRSLAIAIVAGVLTVGALGMGTIALFRIVSGRANVSHVAPSSSSSAPNVVDTTRVSAPLERAAPPVASVSVTTAASAPPPRASSSSSVPRTRPAETPRPHPVPIDDVPATR